MKTRVDNRAARRSAWALAVTMASLVAPAAAEPNGLRVFQQQPIPPWQLFVGDATNWQVPLPDGTGASFGGIVTVTRSDRDVKEGSLHVEWSGKGEGQLYFQAAAPQDFTSLLDAEAALLIDLRVDAPSRKPVFLRMDCGYPCGARGEITGPLRAAPRGEWVRLSVDLRCFANSGADMKRIDTPLLIATSGRLSVSLGDARIVPGIANQAAISCPPGH